MSEARWPSKLFDLLSLAVPGTERLIQLLTLSVFTRGLLYCFRIGENVPAQIS